MDISVYGGDERIGYAAGYLGCFADVKMLDEDTSDSKSKKADCLVLGLPASRDGIRINAPLCENALLISDIPKLVKKHGVVAAGLVGKELYKVCADNGIYCEDYYTDETLVLKNALLTAEGALALGINSTHCGMKNMRVLVTGYGRIATFLARYLKALGAAVTVAARSEAKRALACLDGSDAADFLTLHRTLGSFELIYNTVPAVVLGKDEVSKMSSDAVYIELASSSGIDLAAAREKGIEIICAKGLPSLTAPKTAGILIGESVLRILKKYPIPT